MDKSNNFGFFSVFGYGQYETSDAGFFFFAECKFLYTIIFNHLGKSVS